MPHSRVQLAPQLEDIRRVAAGVHDQVSGGRGGWQGVWHCSNPLCLRKSHLKFLKSKRGYSAEKTDTICYLVTHANSIATVF